MRSANFLKHWRSSKSLPTIPAATSPNRPSANGVDNVKGGKAIGNLSGRSWNPQNGPSTRFWLVDPSKSIAEIAAILEIPSCQAGIVVLGCRGKGIA